MTYDKDSGRAPGAGAAGERQILSNEVAIVTGAGRGIGAATCRSLARAGARVVVTARRYEAANDVARAIPGSLALACDISDPASVAALVQAVEDRLGAPSIVINNAGVIEPIGRLADIEPEAFAASIRTTLTGTALVSRSVLPAMVSAGRGTIVNLSSGAAHKPLEGWSAYCAAKAGVAMLTRSIALEYAAAGIRAFGFAPGLVDTDMQSEIRGSGINPISQLPRERLAPVDEPAEAIAFLCGAAADPYAGKEIDIRDADFRSAAGLPPVEET